MYILMIIMTSNTFCRIYYAYINMHIENTVSIIL